MCRSQRELSNEYLLAKIGVDTAENEPFKVWGKIQLNIHLPPRSYANVCADSYTYTCADSCTYSSADVSDEHGGWRWRHIQRQQLRLHES